MTEFANSGKQYANADKNITQVNPTSIEIIVAKTVLTTEKHPLIPNAHGISILLILLRWAMPEGKGNPIKNDRGAIINKANSSFKIIGNDIVKLRTGVNKNE